MLEEITQRRREFSFHASKSFWARKGDQMCRGFFRTHGHRSAGEQICSLRAQDGSIKTSPEEVIDMATDYYKTSPEEVIDKSLAGTSRPSSSPL